MSRYALREREGRVQARWYDDAGRRRSKTFATRTEAKRFLDRVSADRQRGEYIDPREGQRELRAVAEKWLASRTLRPKTRATYAGVLRCHVYPAFGSRPIAGITAMDIQEWMTRLTAGGLSAGSVLNCFRVLKAVLDAAVKSRYLLGNPAAALGRNDLPKYLQREPRFLTAAQVMALAGEFEPEYALMVEFAAWTGMRAGEIAGLRWENVDLAKASIGVCESISRVGEVDYVNPPKNGKARTVRVGGALIAKVKDFAESRPVHPAFTPQHYLWPGPHGPSEPMNWSKDFYLPRWKAAVARAGLDPKLRFHDLRHTCASLLIAQDLAPKLIQEHLGHSKFAITMDLYGHLYADAGDDLAAAMDRAFDLKPTNATGTKTGPSEQGQAPV